jgi:hypothetical protein
MLGLFKSITGIDGGVAIGFVLMLVIAGLSLSRCQHVSSELATERACVAALADEKGAGSAEHCDPVLVARVQAYRDQGVCNAALQLGGSSSLCPTAVQKVVQARDSAEASLTTLQADQSAAITRAEARAAQSLKRQVQSHEILKGVAAGPDGLILCDTVCLRSRFDDEPH